MYTQLTLTHVSPNLRLSRGCCCKRYAAASKIENEKLMQSSTNNNIIPIVDKIRGGALQNKFGFIQIHYEIINVWEQRSFIVKCNIAHLLLCFTFVANLSSYDLVLVKRLYISEVIHFLYTFQKSYENNVDRSEF